MYLLFLPPTTKGPQSLAATESIICHYSFHFPELYMNGIIPYAVFCVSILLLRVTILRSIYVVLYNTSSFFFYYILVFHMEKAMATHSSTLVWKIPWTEEPGRLQSMGSQRVGHDWVTSLSLFTFTHWRKKWQPTPMFLPGESQGWGSLVDYHLWGRTELDTT